jgi:adenylosuccinate synthase
VDVLSAFDEIPVCTAYELCGEMVETMLHTRELERAKPILHTFESWGMGCDWQSPDARQSAAITRYLGSIEAATGAPVALVSYGPEREATRVMGTLDLWNAARRQQPLAANHA